MTQKLIQFILGLECDHCPHDVTVYGYIMRRRWLCCKCSATWEEVEPLA